MLQTDVRHELKRTFFAPWRDVDGRRLAAALAELEARGREHLKSEGIVASRISFQRSADFRYEGQEYQITCPLPQRAIDKDRVRRDFDSAYLGRYGHQNPDAGMEIVTIRVMAIGRLERPKSVSPRAGKVSFLETRPVWFDGKALKTAIVERSGLGRGDSVKGPAVIEEATATTILPPGWHAGIAAGGHMILRRER
jgi:N-methylhydantoinase A